MPKVQAYKNVKKVRRHDRVDYYHRLARTDAGTMPRLPGEYGSIQFVEAWLEAEKSAAARSAAPEEAEAKSYGALWRAYSEQAAWKPRTRQDYEKVMAWLLIDHGDKPAASLKQKHAEALLDSAVAEKWHRFANYVLQVNRAMFNWVLERASRKEKWGSENPWLTLKPPKDQKRKKQNRAWLPEEVAAVLLEAPIGLARAYVLGASGFDVGTMYGLTWNDYREGLFENERIKSGVGGLTRVPAPLRPILDTGNRPAVQICTNEHGMPFASASSLSTASSRFLRSMHDQDKTGASLTMHGLRHTIAKAIADGGGSLRAIQTALRHSSTRMSLHYSDEADKRRALFSASDAVDSFFIGTPRKELLAQNADEE